MVSWVLGIILGGTVISSLGAISTYTMEEKIPTIKSISRDFIIGSILFCFILYLLPDSTNSVLTYLTSLFALTTTALSPITPIEEAIEIEVGIPKF